MIKRNITFFIFKPTKENGKKQFTNILEKSLLI